MNYTCESWLLSRNKAMHVLGTKNAHTFEELAETFGLRPVRGSRYTRAELERVIAENFGSAAEAARARLREETGI